MNDKAKFLEVSESQQNKIDIIRELFSDVYDTVDNTCNHKNREYEFGIQKLEEAQFWFIKGITREYK